MSFPRYPEYKASGVEWLGDVPGHWDVKKLKYVCSNMSSNVDKKSVDGQSLVKLCNYTDVYYNDYISFDLEFMQATATDDQIHKFGLLADDVLITKDSETPDDIAKSAYVRNDMPGVICGYHLAMIRPNQKVVLGLFIKRLFDSIFIRSKVATLANGLTRHGLSHAAIDCLELPVPPKQEQQAIASFLDRETAKIDGLIEEQRRLVELLKEKRQAVISHAVTKGLNPNAPMKPSGIEWLGDIPEHWEIVALKRFATIRTGVAKGKDHGNEETINVPYLRVANVQDGYLDLNTIATIDILHQELDRYRLKKNDLLMNEGGDFDKLGRGYVWEGQIDPCITQNHVFAVRSQIVDPWWLNCITSSEYAQFYFMSLSKQSTNLASISSTNIMNLPVILPPETEQKQLLQFINSSSDQFNNLISEAEKSITLLQERRTALISAAVTGKIDVRGLANAESTV